MQIKTKNKTNFEELNKNIIECNKCSRLVKFRKKISIEKRKQYNHEKYWGKPITGFGDQDGKILFVNIYKPSITLAITGNWADLTAS